MNDQLKPRILDLINFVVLVLRFAVLCCRHRFHQISSMKVNRHRFTLNSEYQQHNVITTIARNFCNDNSTPDYLNTSCFFPSLLSCSSFNKHTDEYTYTHTSRTNTMAPPHTMKYKDEPEILMTMNPPLSTIINSAKAKPAASPTTLTPGMEALKLATTPLFDLDTQIIDSTLPSTPMPAARRSYKQLSPRLSPQLNYMIANDLKETWSTKGPRGKAILLFFSLASSESEIAAAKQVDESISKFKHANEMLAQSDGESGGGSNIKDDNHHLVVMLIDANKDFSKWVENYRRLVAEGGDKFKGADVWWEEVREIEGLVGEWEAVFPDGAWEVPFEKLGAVDDQIAAEYGEVRPQVLESLGEKKKKKKRSRRRKKGGKNADRGRSSGCESSADESDGAKDGVGKKKTGVKRLAEELETKGTNWSDASVDGSNESMEYISPFKVVTKKDPKEEVYKRMENFALEDEEDETEKRDAKPDCEYSIHQFPLLF